MKVFLISKQNRKGYTKCVFIDLYEFNSTPLYECLLKPSQTKDLHHGSIFETDVNFTNITEIHIEHSYRIGVVSGNNKGSLLVYSKQQEPHYINVNYSVGSNVKFAEIGNKVLLNKSENGEYYIVHNITTEKMKNSINQLTK